MTQDVGGLFNFRFGGRKGGSEYVPLDEPFLCLLKSRSVNDHYRTGPNCGSPTWLWMNRIIGFNSLHTLPAAPSRLLMG